MTESRELTEYGGGRALAAPSSGEIIQSILAASRDKDVDAAKVETLTRLATGMIDRERESEFNRAKIAAIREMPAIYKRGKSDKHRYAKFEDLHRAVMPVLARHGLTLDFRIGNEGNLITVQPILRHDNGWVEEGGVMKGPADTGPGRSAIQAIGSSASYLKRHSMKAMLNIIEDGEDDDGSGYGTREGDQLTDRQQRLIIDAEAAENYADWYGKQTAKDKAWLVRTGVHARLGGGAALPPVSSSPVGRGEQEPEDAEVEAVDEPALQVDERPEPEPSRAEPEPDPKTAEGWTTLFERKCAAAQSRAELATAEREGANAIRKLSTEHPKLWERVDRAIMDAKDRLPADDDVFPGDR